MKFRHGTLWVFFLCLLAVVVALAWVTRHALRLERGEQIAQSRARHQESLRLALWRMDTIVAAFLARESARPYFEYRPYYPADRAYTKMWEEVQPGEVLVASPLLAGGDPLVKLYFEQTPDGRVVSPQAPSDALRKLADFASRKDDADLAWRRRDEIAKLLSNTVDGERSPNEGEVDKQPAVGNEPQNAGEAAAIGQQAAGPTTQLMDQSREEYRARQEATQTAANRGPAPAASTRSSGVKDNPVREKPGAPPLDAAAQKNDDPKEASAKEGEWVPPPAPGAVASPTSAPVTTSASKLNASDAAGSPKLKALEPEKARDEKAPAQSAGLPKKEPARDQDDEGTLGMVVGGRLEPTEAPSHPLTREEPVEVGHFSARWVVDTAAPELVYTRRVRIGDLASDQGMWLDWGALRAELLRGVRDIFPSADVHAALTSDADPKADLGRRLASVPADLVVADPPVPLAPGWSPTRTTLLVTWLGVLSGFAAIAFSLRAATDLAERRGRFVSAVTHELRTPLTTFCMYSQMLADKMVPEGEATERYHSTLRQESERLAGIVESVLEYARLGRRQDNGRVPSESLSVGELFQKLEPLLRRRAAQGGMELVVESQGPTDQTLRTDPGTVERILFNLVDNACKYASASPDKRVHLAIHVRDGAAEFRVSDHGPGIAAGERSSVFQAFFRGTRHSHGSIPGLGLGLALAQGLARDVRGSLRLADASRAEFVLSLPLA